jgi:ribosomal protein S18 acetylase RimI-like enzyme
MEIRKLTPHDCDEIVSLWTRAGLPFKPKGRDSREALTAQMKMNPDFFLGAWENNHLVGTVIASCDTRRGWINRLAVDPDYRRRRIATALMAEAEKTLRERGTRILCAQIEGVNTASKAFLKTCGFVEHHDIVYFSKRDNGEV